MVGVRPVSRLRWWAARRHPRRVSGPGVAICAGWAALTSPSATSQRSWRRHSRRVGGWSEHNTGPGPDGNDTQGDSGRYGEGGDRVEPTPGHAYAGPGQGPPPEQVGQGTGPGQGRPDVEPHQGGEHGNGAERC